MEIQDFYEHIHIARAANILYNGGEGMPGLSGT